MENNMIQDKIVVVDNIGKVVCEILGYSNHCFVLSQMDDLIKIMRVEIIKKYVMINISKRCGNLSNEEWMTELPSLTVVKDMIKEIILIILESGDIDSKNYMQLLEDDTIISIIATHIIERIEIEGILDPMIEKNRIEEMMEDNVIAPCLAETIIEEYHNTHDKNLWTQFYKLFLSEIASLVASQRYYEAYTKYHQMILALKDYFGKKDCEILSSNLEKFMVTQKCEKTKVLLSIKI